MSCVICQSVIGQTEEDERLLSIQDATAVSDTPVLFLLYKHFEMTAVDGHLCLDCSGLVEKIDSLESQLQSVKLALKCKITQTVFNSNSNVETKPCTDQIETPSQSETSNFWKQPCNSDKVDTNIFIATTQRGEDQLIYEGHSYRKKTRLDIQDKRVLKWRCSKQACRSKIATSEDGICVFLDSLTRHNHSPNHSGTSGLLLRERIREITLNHPTMKTADILASAEMLSASGKSSHSLRNDKSLLRYVQRLKAKQQLT